MAATIAAFRAGDQPHYSQVYDAGAAIMVAQVKNGVVIGFEEMAEKYGIKSMLTIIFQELKISMLTLMEK